MLKIHNTLTRNKEKFKPIKKNQVGFYHCGPTVYWTQHIGNMRAMVLADFIRRSLEYLGYQVNMVRNYTDVGHLSSDEDEGEDKLAKGAKREGKTPMAIANQYIETFNQDAVDLNIMMPEKCPRATEEIPVMIKMIETLLSKGYAYSTDLAIYFDISKFKNYTALSGQDLDKNIATAGKAEVSDTSKKHPADFALWFFKAGTHKNALQTWPSPFQSPVVENGQGFPGWHLECSAMSQKYLGETIDIHMGGVEHISVHHTNEIAQSESATGKTFVNYWLHNEHLNVDGGKMSKSEGTSYVLTDIKAKDYEPLSLRYFYLQAHYRSKQNFTWQALSASQESLNRIRDRVMEMKKAVKPKKVDTKFKQQFISALEDDFNLPQALAVGWEVLKSDLKDQDKLATILDFDRVFGLNLNQVAEVAVPPAVEELAQKRLMAREAKQWDEADDLRDQILDQGFIVDDVSGGYKLKKK